MIKTNVNDFLDKIETEDVVKVYLSVEELYKLAETPCKKPILKIASLFSCMTSLRISDILPEGNAYTSLRKRTRRKTSSPSARKPWN